MSTSLSYSSGVLSCSFVKNIFPCCLILFKFLFIFYVCGRFVMFLFLEKWPSVGDVLCVPAVYSSLVTQWPVPAGPRVGSDLCCRLSSAACRIIIFLLLVSAPLMAEAGLEACIGFLVGGISVCPLLGRARSWPSGRHGPVKGPV